MKNLSKTLFSFFLIVILASCSSQSTVVDNKTSKLLNTENFTFIAEEANYDGYNYTLEDISRKENSWENLPNFRERKVFVRSKSTPLDAEYSVAVTNNKLEIFLPYFLGLNKEWTTNPSRTIQYTTSDSGFIKLISTDFTVDQKINKNGKTTLTIIANDITNPVKIKIDVFKDGKSLLVVDSSIRKSSSFRGYITTNAIAKN